MSATTKVATTTDSSNLRALAVHVLHHARMAERNVGRRHYRWAAQHLLAVRIVLEAHAGQYQRAEVRS